MMATQLAKVMGLPAAWATAFETFVKNFETDIGYPATATGPRLTLSLPKGRSASSGALSKRGALLQLRKDERFAEDYF
jgi:hypothetical protein